MNHLVRERGAHAHRRCVYNVLAGSDDKGSTSPDECEDTCSDDDEDEMVSSLKEPAEKSAAEMAERERDDEWCRMVNEDLMDEWLNVDGYCPANIGYD